jgi:hypothetical protein
MRKLIKKYISLAVLLTLALVLPVQSYAASAGYGATALTGGTSGCLDAIDGAGLLDGDKAFVLTSTQFYFYTLDDDSAAVESPPDIISPDSNAGDKRWVQVSSHSIFGLSSLTAGDLPYASAANTLAALGIGAANYKLFTNAAGAAPEWGAGLNVVSTTKDLSIGAPTDQSISGFGFKPSAVAILAAISGSVGNMSIGFIGPSGTGGGFYDYSAVAVNTNSWISMTAAVLIRTDVGDYNLAALKSWDADGLTLTWTKTGNPVGTATLVILGIR